MCLIYFLQNAGFSSFPDQASCLECWDLNSRNLLCRSNPESICGLGCLGGPVALTDTNVFPSWLPGLQAACLLRALAFICALHIQSHGIFNGHSGFSVPISKLGPKGEQQEKGIELGREEGSFEKLQFSIFVFFLFFLE